MSGERELLAETVRALVSKHAGPAAVREAMDSELGYDGSLGKLLCEQVGAAALVVPEEFGGAGGELASAAGGELASAAGGELAYAAVPELAYAAVPELAYAAVPELAYAAAVLEELGRGLVPTPLLGTTLAELALLAADEPDADTLGQLAEGTSIGAVVLDPDYVVNGDIADVVVAVDGDRLVRWTRFSATPVATMDPTRRLARVEPQETESLGVDPGIADTAAILLAAEQVGAADRCLELTVDYTKSRIQFGRPIGSFQALKHRMADLYVAVQAARAVVGDAIADPTPTTAALARVAASEAFSAVAAEGIQMHGGIAITWEHDMQLYFKRAHGSAHLLGPRRHHLRRLEARAFDEHVFD